MSRTIGVIVVVTLLWAAGGSPAGADPGASGNSLETTVDARATGGFGPVLGGIEPDLSVQDLVEVMTLRQGERVTISATGTIDIQTNVPGTGIIGPDGLTALTRPPIPLFFPLEEAFVDASGFGTLPDPPILNLGGLMGAFVSDDVVDATGFRARNDDPDPNPALAFLGIPDPPVIGGVSSDDLFLVGSSPLVLVAPEDGTLFLGINDAFTPNNAGAFDVLITPGSSGNKIMLCHAGHVINVGTAAVPSHEAHGDTLGDC